jgi:predicted ribonuclease YlaK
MKREGKVPPNAGIAAYYDAMNDDKLKVIIAEGDAGTGKTFQAVIHAIKEVKEGKKTKIVLISSKESKNPLGALPGDKKAKMEPLVATCKSAIAAYLMEQPEFKKKRNELRQFGDVEIEVYASPDESDYGYKKGKSKKGKRKREHIDIDYAVSHDEYVGGFEKTHSPKDSSHHKDEPGKPIKEISGLSFSQFLKREVDHIFDRYFECYPREEVDGMTFDDVIIIVDEIQRIHDLQELLTILTRSARQSKMILCGDTKQIRKATEEKLTNNGITYAKARYFNWEKCAVIHLTDQMRGEAAAYETDDYEEAYARIAGF